MDMENRDMQYINMRSMQERPITLGELLLREESMEDMESPAPPRSMGRTMSPTRCLGSLASGRPRRARGRTMTRQSTAPDEYDDIFGESQLSQPQDRRRHAITGSLTMAGLARYRNATAEARLRNFYSIMNGPRPSRRRGASAAARPRLRSLERSESPDLFYNPFSWQRRSGGSAGRRQTRSRSASNAGTMSRPLRQGRSQRMRSSLYDSREERSTSSYRCLRAGRPYSGRADPETRPNTANGNGSSDISASMRRFIDFTAEFIPVEQQTPDAEPPEWSLNVTAADFGPFAVGRSALSRARSLAIIGALSQVTDEPTETPPNPFEN